MHRTEILTGYVEFRCGNLRFLTNISLYMYLGNDKRLIHCVSKKCAS